eukprot:TRINITY_DN1706_c0_g1_i2.p1 TRINITY_DN1706_c0_g1~~TRINITY_DN1706_c0_g1_i2.p1  ORF type:complete len:538 (-),score=145.97 TRINITY_DN1706_c0_g1_i2:101-1516(-)
MPTTKMSEGVVELLFPTELKPATPGAILSIGGFQIVLVPGVPCFRTNGVCFSFPALIQHTGDVVSTTACFTVLFPELTPPDLMAGFVDLLSVICDLQSAGGVAEIAAGGGSEATACDDTSSLCASLPTPPQYLPGPAPTASAPSAIAASVTLPEANNDLLVSQPPPTQQLSEADYTPADATPAHLLSYMQSEATVTSQLVSGLPDVPLCPPCGVLSVPRDTATAAAAPPLTYSVLSGVGSAIDTAATLASQGIMYSGTKLAVGIDKGEKMISNYVTPTAQPIDPPALVRYSVTTLQTIAPATVFVAHGISSVFNCVADLVAQAFVTPVSKGLDAVQADSNKTTVTYTIEGVKECTKNSLQGFLTVWMSLETAGTMVVKASGDAVTHGVQHKYGERAGKVTADGMYALGDIGYSTYTMASLASGKGIAKTFVKKVVTHTATEVLKQDALKKERQRKLKEQQEQTPEVEYLPL